MERWWNRNQAWIESYSIKAGECLKLFWSISNSGQAGFESINSTISIEDIYYQLNNEDIAKYLKDKEEKEEENN